ncbi:MAG TPA: hypothetical protein VLJ59_13600 [Mycobacteriales bacterium]|nr:hypothetical protein [Mycobacteriales bacterium]
MLSGPPSNVRGVVPVDNPGNQRLVVRGVIVHRDGAPDLTISTAVVVSPGARVSVPVTVSLPAGTPPGDIAAELEVAGNRHPAVLRVEQQLAMRVSPAQVLARPGQVAVELVVHNDGNVAIALAREAHGYTRDDGDSVGPDIRLSLGNVGEVGPGAQVEVTATLDVPADLAPYRRHEARIPVGLTDLAVVVLPRDPD